MIHQTFRNHVNLVIVDVMKADIMFKNVADCSVLLAALSHRKCYSSFFETQSPTIPATRWLYLFEFTQWILENEISVKNMLSRVETVIKNFHNDIQKYQVLKQVIFDDFKRVYLLLKPLRMLNDKLEKDSTFLGQVLPLVELTAANIGKLRENELFYDTDHIDILLRIFAARFRKTAKADLLCLAYSLTAEGRYQLGISPDYPPNDPHHENKYHKLTNGITDDIIQFENVSPFSDKVKYRRELTNYLLEIDPITNDYDAYKHCLQKLTNSKDQIHQVFPDKIIAAKNALCEHLTRLYFNDPDCEKMIKTIQHQYDHFIHRKDIELTKRINLYIAEDTYTMWTDIYNAGLLKELSRYALSICCISATEASVERLFSAVKRIITPRQRTSIPLLEAYVNLLPRSNPDLILQFDDDEDAKLEKITEEEEANDRNEHFEMIGRNERGKKKKMHQTSIKNFTTGL